MRIVRSFRHRPRFWFLAGLVLVSFFFFLFLFFLPSLSLTAKVKNLPFKVKLLKDALLLYDLSRLETELTVLRQDLEVIDKDASKLKLFSVIPFLGAYVADVKNLSDFSLQALKLSLQLTEIIKPFGPALGFKVKEFPQAPAAGQERLFGLARASPTLSREWLTLKKDIESLAKRLKGLDPNRYPQEFRGLKISSNLRRLREAVLALETSFADVASFFDVLPSLLGMEGKRNYLVLFQNDKELRPTGGFLTAYAIFTLDKGKIVGTRSGDMYFLDIDNKVPFYPPAPAVIQKYLKIKDFYIRDANLSPDFRLSAKSVEEIWNRVPGVPKVDGIIALDTHFVESMIAVLGEIAVPGYETFTQENVVSQLELFSTILGTRLEKRQSRKDLIGVLMQLMLQKAFASGGKQNLNLLVKAWQEGQEKHLIFNFDDPRGQKLVEKYKLAGAIIDYSGDYLHINDSNFAGRKANWFIKEEVAKQVVVEKERILSTLKIDLENTGKYHADFNTGYRDYVRVYVPPGSKLISAEGSLDPVTTGEELGKTYFAAYLAVDPLKKVRLNLKYESPREIVKGNIYRLLIQKQPGTDKFRYEVKVGKKVESFELLTDKEVEVRL